MRRGAGVKLGGSDTQTLPHRLPEFIFFVELGILALTGLAPDVREYSASRTPQVAVRCTNRSTARAKRVSWEANLP
jgi:hypothetical protein